MPTHTHLTNQTKFASRVPNSGMWRVLPKEKKPRKMRLKNPEKNPSGLSQKYWIVGWWNHTPLTQRLEKNNAELLSSSDPHPETLFWHSFFHTIWIHLEIFKAYWFWLSFWHILWHSIWHPFSFLSPWDYWWDVQNHQWNKKCSSDYREA